MQRLGIFILIASGSALSCSGPEVGACEAPRVVAVVPARAGSKGIKDKNLSPVGNESLISRTLRIANEVGEFDSIWISTDGERIAEEGLKSGARIHWRSAETAGDTASTVSAVEEFLQAQKGYDIVAVLQCTSPFLQKHYLLEALKIMKTTDADCVFSVTESFQLRWNQHEDGFAFPLNFDPKNRPRRQDWAGEILENGMFYLAKTRLVLQDKVLQNEKCKTVKIPKRFSLEIDTEDDLQLARILLPLLENRSNT